MAHNGSCLCGAVTYSLAKPPTESGVCHCSMCRKWTGGAFIAFTVAPEDIVMEGTDNLNIFASSDWAERASCAKCGGNLFYRVTAPGPEQGVYHMGLGTLDNANGAPVRQEIFIDEKPDGYAFQGDTRKMTGAEVFAMYAPPA